MLYMVTFTINIPQMLAYIPYMNPMGFSIAFCKRLPGRVPHIRWLFFRTQVVGGVSGRLTHEARRDVEDVEWH